MIHPKINPQVVPNLYKFFFSFFFLFNMKEDILKNVGYQTVEGTH